MADQDVHSTVVDVINRVLSDSGRPTRSIENDDTFTGTLGRDSLDLAVMVVGLEQQLGVDPFRAGAKPVANVGQLVELYEQTVRDQA